MHIFMGYGIYLLDIFGINILFIQYPCNIFHKLYSFIFDSTLYFCASSF